MVMVGSLEWFILLGVRYGDWLVHSSGSFCWVYGMVTGRFTRVVHSVGCTIW